jgi:hypothetical protein
VRKGDHCMGQDSNDKETTHPAGTKRECGFSQTSVDSMPPSHKFGKEPRRDHLRHRILDGRNDHVCKQNKPLPVLHSSHEPPQKHLGSPANGKLAESKRLVEGTRQTDDRSNVLHFRGQGQSLGDKDLRTTMPMAQPCRGGS